MYACYKAMLIQRINFLDMYVCMHVVRGAFFFFFFFFYVDTISHELNGRRESKNSIQKRHNRLASIAVQNVRGRFSRAVILEDQIVQLS